VIVSEPELHIATGIAVTVGIGKTLVIDVLELPN
jgi:hypothetical protein